MLVMLPITVLVQQAANRSPLAAGGPPPASLPLHTFLVHDLFLCGRWQCQENAQHLANRTT